MEAPKISVVMSVYNGEKYLREAIDSILNQTFSDFEFIIIEDASTDKTLSILESYAEKDSRIIIIKKEQNKGTKGFIENLNIGLEKAKGKYIARMDADDISVTNRFEKQIETLEKDSELFIIGAALQLIDKNGNNTKVMRTPQNDTDIKRAMYNVISLYHPVIMFRNNSQIKYREKMYTCEDYDLYFQLILQDKKMANLPEILLKYRVLEGSVSRRDKTFIRYTFVEKARQFYHEGLKNTKDSYDLFDPDKLLKILDSNYKNTLNDLKLGLNTALKFSNDEETDFLIKKMKKYYPNESVLKYKIASKLHRKIYSLYSKFMNV